MSHHHKHSTSHRATFLSVTGALAVVLIVLALYAIITLGHTKPQSLSPEPHFTDASASGLQIVPASGGSAPTCTVSYTPSTIYPGDSTYVQWNSTDATGRTHIVYKDGAYFGGPYNTGSVSGSFTITYADLATQVGYGTLRRDDTVTGAGGSGTCSATIVIVPPSAPTCSLSVAPTTVNQPSAATLSWNSTQATTYYITNVSYVTPNQAGSTSVAPSATTLYTGTATNSYGSTQCTATLTVNRSCTFNGSTVTHGSSVTAYQDTWVPYGNSCVSQTRTCTDGTLSGSYAQSYCSVGAPASCTLDGVTIAHGASRTFYSQQTTTGGTLCSAVSQSRTCTNGTLSGSASYQYANCTCAASYSCSGNNVVYTDAACSTTTTVCAAPSYCSAGLPSCQWPPITPTQSGSFTGHLEARPSIVRTGSTTHLYWNAVNAVSCTVSGGGQTWNTATSGPSGALTNAITEQTVYTLACAAGGSNPALNETVRVIVQPNFNEQ